MTVYLDLSAKRIQAYLARTPRAMRKVVSAGHEVFSGCWGRPRMESMRCGSLWILRMVAAIRV